MLLLRQRGLPAGLALENNEPVFSQLIRFSRAAAYDWTTLVGKRGAGHPTLVRDFPVGLITYATIVQAEIAQLDRLLQCHTALHYYAGAMRHGEREKALTDALVFPRGDLVKSIGTTANHMRWCTTCAREECKTRGFSWWHRDHQLPLTGICLLHHQFLAEVNIDRMGRHLPHELTPASCTTDTLPGRFEFVVARLEGAIAAGWNRAQLVQTPHALRDIHSRCIDSNGSRLLEAVHEAEADTPRHGLRESLSLLANPGNVQRCASWLLGRYPQGIDPVLGVLLLAIILASDPHWSDSSVHGRQASWRMPSC